MENKNKLYIGIAVVVIIFINFLGCLKEYQNYCKEEFNPIINHSEIPENKYEWVDMRDLDTLFR